MVIKANELRVGNILLDKDGKPAQVEAICRVPSSASYLIEFAGLGNTSGFVEELKPIELSPEMLLRCGFEKNGKNYFSHNDKFYHIQEDAYDCNGNFGYCLNDEKSIFLELKSLHQLQNLYFCLTGEELEINL